MRTKPNTPRLGKLKLVDLRKIWKHEAYDFTQWLAKGKVDYQNTEDWNRQFTWLLEKAIDFRQVFGK